MSCNRVLNAREAEMLRMIRPTTFKDVVSTVRHDIEYSRYDAKKELRYMKNKDDENKTESGNSHGNFQST